MRPAAPELGAKDGSQGAAFRPNATASYSDEEMRAALDINIPNYASAIVSTKEIVNSTSSL